MIRIWAALPCQDVTGRYFLVAAWHSTDILLQTTKWIRFSFVLLRLLKPHIIFSWTLKCISPHLLVRCLLETRELLESGYQHHDFDWQVGVEFYPLMAPDGCIAMTILFFNFIAQLLYLHCMNNKGKSSVLLSENSASSTTCNHILLMSIGCRAEIETCSLLSLSSSSLTSTRLNVKVYCSLRLKGSSLFNLWPHPESLKIILNQNQQWGHSVLTPRSTPVHLYGKVRS